MKKSLREAGQAKTGRDLELSRRFEAKRKKSKRRRAGEKAGRRAAGGR